MLKGSIWVLVWFTGYGVKSSLIEEGDGGQLLNSKRCPKIRSDAASTCSSSPGEGHRRVNVVGSGRMKADQDQAHRKALN